MLFFFFTLNTRILFLLQGVLFAICNNFMVSLWLLSVGAFCIPLYIPYALTGIWHFGRGICKLWLLMDYLMCSASVFNIVIISYDRFLSVTKAVSTLFIASLSFVARRWDLAGLYLDTSIVHVAILVNIGLGLMKIIAFRTYAGMWR